MQKDRVRRAAQIPGPGIDNKAYANHLAEINQTTEVLSTEDIVNESGALVVPKGSRITHDVASKIMRHKLLKPFERQVNIKDALNGESLHAHFEALFEKCADIDAIHQAAGFANKFSGLVRGYKLDFVLAQKLTVLFKQLPLEFEKSLFCAWLSALTAFQLEMEWDDIVVAYVAGIVHDIGLLHIDPAIIHKQGALTADEWRAMQSHVVIGKMILADITSLDPRIATAVFEHHENSEGVGYPLGKDSGLDVIGQIVAMADSLQAIRTKQFSAAGRGLQDAVPFLQLNAYTHLYAVYRAVTVLIKQSGLSITKSNPYEDLGVYAKALFEHGKILKNSIELLEKIQGLLKVMRIGAKGRFVVKVTEFVVILNTQSGLECDELLAWLGSVTKAADASVLEELNAIELMQNELSWQFNRVLRALLEFLESEGDAACPQYVAVKQLYSGMKALQRAAKDAKAN